MVRELREIVESIASIDTSVDIEDVKAVAQFNPETDQKIRDLREFLLKLNIKPTSELPVVTAETPCIVEPYSKSDAEITTQMYEYQELTELGFTLEQIDAWHKLYNARKTNKKMSFVVCIKCCKFVADKIAGSKQRLLKVKMIPIFKEYLKMIDPNTEYNLCNIHDFLKGAALSSVSSQFFKFEGGYLVGVKQT